MNRKAVFEYASRSQLLKRFGFKSYDAYLESDLWKKIRAAKLKQNPECYGCGKTATQVHHGRYTILNMLGHTLEHLLSVCGGCHFKSEFHRNGNKVGPRIATKQLKRIRKRKRWTATEFGKSFWYSERKPTIDDEYRAVLE